MAAMKIWKLHSPVSQTYAIATRVGGTWQGDEYEERWGVLEIEWERGSGPLSDFVWPGVASEIAVSERVGRAIVDHAVDGVELRPVRERNARPRGNPTADEAPLSDLWVTQWTAMDRAASTFQTEPRSDGGICVIPTGVEDKRSRWDPETRSLIMTHRPREPGKGIMVHDVAGVFRIQEFPAWIFCTDSVRQLIEHASFTNVAFLEMGDVV